MIIDNKIIQSVLGIKPLEKISCQQLDLVNTKLPNSLSFIDDKKFISDIINNKNIVAVFVTEEIASEMNKLSVNKIKIICSEPRHSFYSLFNFIAKSQYKKNVNQIDSTAKIHPKAYIAEFNVVIGANTVIDANASVLSDVVIGKNCLIRHGAVLGYDGFEFKRTKTGMLSVFHDGKLIIKDEVEIGSNSVIEKGLMHRDTIIGNETKIDNLVYIAHRVHIGERCLIIGHAMICGFVTMGDDVWVGPRAVISNLLNIGNGASITIGSVVTTDVASNQKVSGNFAIDHKKFVSFIKTIR